MSFQFEWDRSKAEANAKKHGVGFDEALTVFADPLPRIFNHPDTADMRAEYEFDYREAKANRFASQVTRDVVTVSSLRGAWANAQVVGLHKRPIG
jgi:hypothetical protein